MKKTAIKHFWGFFVFACFVAFILTVILTGVNYMTRVNLAIETEIEENIKNALEVNAYAAKRSLEEDLFQIRAMGMIIGEERRGLQEKEDILHFLSYYVKSNSYTRIGISGLDGVLYTSDRHEISVAQEIGFQRALSGADTITSLAADQISGRRIIVFYTPVKIGGEVKAVICAAKYARDMEEKFLGRFYNGKGYCYIVDRAGNVIFSGGSAERREGSLDDQNIYNPVTKYNHRADSRSFEEKIKDELEQGRSGVALAEINGVKKYIGYVPLDVNSEWSLIGEIDHRVMIEKSKGILTGMSTIFAGLFLSLIVFIIYFIYMEKKKQDILRQSKQNLKNIAENISGGVLTILADEGYTIEYVNDGFLKLFAMTKSEYDMKDRWSIIDFVARGDREKLNDLLGRPWREGDHVAIELSLEKNGRMTPVLFRGTFAKDAKLRAVFYCVAIDISEQKSYMKQIEIEKERYRIITDQAEDIIFEIDLKNDMIYCSPKYEELFGSDVFGVKFSSYFIENNVIHPDDLTIFDCFYDQILHDFAGGKFELRLAKTTGEYIWCELQFGAIKDEEGHAYRVVGKITNIDFRKKEHEKLRYLSQRDPLSGLFNKAAMQSMIEAFLTHEGKQGRHAFLFIDIDYFKAVNDSLGHLVGDQAIQDIAGILKREAGPFDLVGRFGGDEFCLFMKYIADHDHAEEKADRLCRALRLKYGEDQAHAISASIGVSIYPDHGGGYGALVEAADQAVYAAKENGKDQYVVYESEKPLS